MNCTNCSAKNLDDSRFCSNCGFAHKRICTKCKAENKLGAKFCSDCGSQMVDLKGMPGRKGSLDRPHAERRQVTVLFSDLVGSTELSELLDPEDLQGLLHKYQVACTQIVLRYEGYLAKYLGDGVLAYFGYPIAHEDDAYRAIQTGLGVVEAVKGISQQIQEELNIAVSVRVGIHTGLVVVGDMDQNNALESNAIVGQTPNLAARIQSEAEPDTVVVSSETYKLSRGYFETKDLGAFNLRGISKAIQIYRVDHESTAKSRLDAAFGELTPFAGREEEIKILEQAWYNAVKGKCQITTVVGEGGVGKSRLLNWLKHFVSNDPAAWLIEIRCSAYHTNSPFYPIIEFLERTSLQFEPTDTDIDKLTKLEGFIAQYGFDVLEALPLMAELLSIAYQKKYPAPILTPLRQKMKTIDLLISIVHLRAERQPLLFVIEDLHWVDPSTLEMLDLLLARSVDTHLMIVMSYRPQFTGEWKQVDRFIQINLNGLAQKNSEEIILRVANQKPLPSEAIEYIILKTDGIPLFLEEMTKTILDSKILIDKGDRYELTGPINTLGIPTTLQDLLMARLDRHPEAKRIAQLAAAVGREFSYEILASIPGIDIRTLNVHLERLVHAEILHKKGTGSLAVYIFIHAMIQDSAYSSLLKSLRKKYHHLIAESIETNSPDQVTKNPELLAQHYMKAYLPEKAIQYWLMAGVRALQRSANLEAISHVREGLQITSHIKDISQQKVFELQLHSTIGPALIASRGFADSEVGEAYEKAGDLSVHLGDGQHLFTPLWGQWVYYLVRGDLKRAEQLALEMLRLAKDSEDSGMMVEANWTLGNTQFWLGNLTSSLESLDSAISIYDSNVHHNQAYLYGQDPGVAARCYRMYVLWSLGMPQQALEEGKKVLDLADSLRHPFSIGWAMAFNFSLHMYNEDYAKNSETASQAIEFCTEQAYPFWLYAAMCNLGWSTCFLESPKKGLPLIEQGLEGWNMIGSILVRPSYLYLYAEALCLDDQVVRALEVADEGIALAQEIYEVVSEIDLHRMRAKCFRLLGKLDEAEKTVTFSVNCAKKIGDLSRQLKGGVELFKILAAKGREKEGALGVTDILSKFTEGFDIAYIKEAQNIIKKYSRTDTQIKSQLL